MILVVSPYNLPKPRSDLSRTMMLPELKLGLDGFELRDHPLLRRNPPDNEWSGGELATEMGETQKREGLRFPFATPLPSSCSEPPKLDQSCLSACNSKPNLASRSRNSSKNRSDFCPVLKAHYQIVGVTDDNDIASRHFLAPGFDP